MILYYLIIYIYLIYLIPYLYSSISIKDAYLPQRLMDKLMCLVNYIEMARVTGIPSISFRPGQQVKKSANFTVKPPKKDSSFLPSKRKQPKSSTRVPLSLNPPRGTTISRSLRLISLPYPSIMMAHNLCYTTLLNPEKIAFFRFRPRRLHQDTHRGLLCQGAREEGHFADYFGGFDFGA